MGVLQIPYVSAEERLRLVPAEAEVLFDTTRKIMFLGDGVSVGGRPLVVEQYPGEYSVGAVTGPRQSSDYALALFSGKTGQILREGPAPGLAKTVLQGMGPGATPAFDYLSLESLRVTAGRGDVLMCGDNGIPYVGRLPTTSLASEGQAGQVMTSNGNTGNPPSFQDPKLGSLLQIRPSKNITRSVAALELTDGIDNTYDAYLLVATNIGPLPRQTPAQDILDISFQVGEVWTTTQHLITAAGTVKTDPTNLDRIKIGSGDTMYKSNNCIALNIKLFSPSDPVIPTIFMIECCSVYTRLSDKTKTDMAFGVYGGCVTLTAPVTGIRIKFVENDISRGTFTLYGLDKSKKT